MVGFWSGITGEFILDDPDLVFETSITNMSIFTGLTPGASDRVILYTQFPALVPIYYFLSRVGPRFPVNVMVKSVHG